jgi:hypothetical protein
MLGLPPSHPATSATIERQDGQKMDVVIHEIAPDAVTVMRQQQDHVVTETIPIADIAKIRKTTAKKMSKTSKVLIATAVAPRRARHRGRCDLRDAFLR